MTATTSRAAIARAAYQAAATKAAIPNVRLILLGTGSLTLDQVSRHTEPLASTVAAHAARAVLDLAWQRAQAAYGGGDLTHSHCMDGGCNLCILDDIRDILAIQPADTEE